MNYVDFALIFFLLLATLNYRVHRSVLYPPFIFSLMWLLDLTLLRSGLIEVDPLHGNTIAIVTAGAAAFSLGGLFAGLAPEKLLRIHIFPSSTAKTPDMLRNFLVVILLCGLPVMFYQILQLSRSVGGGVNILMQARMAGVEAAERGEPSRPLFMTYFIILALSSSLLFATEKRNRQFWIVTVIAFFVCILSTGRTDLLLLISGLGAIQLLQTKRETLFDAIRMLRWPIALFIFLYIVLIFTNKNTDDIQGGVVGIATYFVLSYIVGPLAAFDKVVQHPADFLTNSSHVFQAPLKFAAALHLISFDPPPKIDEFSFVPFPANVYTVFKFYFVELGIGGVIAILFLAGFLHSLLYLKARQGGKLSTFLFAYSVYAVLMVIFDDVYSATGMYTRAAVIGFIYLAIASVPLRLFPAIDIGQPQTNSPLQPGRV
jgi:oligosaccharide repeat unit polymerase